MAATPRLTLHATQALAAKIGGFDAVGSEDAPADREHPLDRWYANVIRRRKPRVIAINPSTLYVVVLALAPAATLARRLPDAIAETLRARGVPEGFIGDVVDPLRGGARVVRTDDRSLVGIMNERSRHMGYFAPETDDDWFAIAMQASETPLLQGVVGEYAVDRMFALVSAWEDEVEAQNDWQG